MTPEAKTASQEQLKRHPGIRGDDVDNRTLPKAGTKAGKTKAGTSTSHAKAETQKPAKAGTSTSHEIPYKKAGKSRDIHIS